MKNPALRWPVILGRVTASVLGGYALTIGFAAAGITVLVALGVDFHEAETGVNLLAFLVFLTLFLWSFTTPSLWRVWVVLLGGALLLNGVALALQHWLLS